MSKVRVLLCCGAGFSSGFLAQKGKQAAKKRKLDLSIEARSESVVSEYLDQIDVLLIGPHYENALERMKEMCAPYGVPVAVIPAEVYSSLDGEKLVDLAMSLAEKEA